MPIEKLTLLHSNDMHGDFLAEVRAGESTLIGGLSLLAGYINQVRRTEENVILAVAGDMLQGSLIDTEYRGISTMDVMNYLAPDVVTLGNHEFDYGLPQLLFLEKMAHFPIVNANLYLKPYNRRLMIPYLILQRGHIRILFIGVITEKVLAELSQDPLISTFISLAEVSEEVRRIVNAYKGEDIDLTVLLTHIGYEADLELAAMLDPAWGVDIIIGGHSHTILDKPTVVNGILIAQAGVGTDQIGRFDLQIDTDEDRIVAYDWHLVPIDSRMAQPDAQLEAHIKHYSEAVDHKYDTILCHLARTLTHPDRTIETELGNLTADILAEAARADVALMGSGAIRLPELGPLVTLRDFMACFPFADTLTKFNITGARLKRIFAHIMRPENRTGQGECYQVNADVRAEYDNAARQLVSLTLRGEPVAAERVYSVCVTGYHLRSCAQFLDITYEELAEIPRPRTIATSMQDVLEEYLRNNQNIARKVEGRLVYR